MTRRVSRRAFVRSGAALVASAAILFWLQRTYAQQSAAPRRIGVLFVGNSIEGTQAKAFRKGLLDAGYSEGRDVVFEFRSANGEYARLPELVADLVKLKVDAIVVESTAAAQIVKRVTTTIPIVLAEVADPLGSGLVPSLARPGGNVTGLSLMSAELSAKRHQLLKQMIPQLTRVAVLWNPATPWHPKAIADLKAAAPALSLKLGFVALRTPDEFILAFTEIGRMHAQGLSLMDDAIFFAHRATLVSLASKAGLPTSYSERLFVDEGGLISYGPNREDMYRRSAGYVDKILKGARPGDLPIEQPTKFELVVNLKTAKTLGLTVPESILLRADEVIR